MEHDAAKVCPREADADPVAPDAEATPGLAESTSVPTAPATTGAEDVDLKSFKASVDVVILMDCTGSMGSWIEAAKKTALDTALEVRQQLPNAEYRLGFVGYRDYGDSNRFVQIDLTQDIGFVQNALKPIRASGGADTAEDVAGGLDKVLKSVPWKGDTRIVIHVADAPAHGQAFHEVLVSDSYPKGDKFGLNPKTQMRELAAAGMDYYFIKVNDSTDKMLKVFAAEFELGKRGDEQTFMVIDLKPQEGTVARTDFDVRAVRAACEEAIASEATTCHYLEPLGAMEAGEDEAECSKPSKGLFGGLSSLFSRKSEAPARSAAFNVHAAPARATSADASGSDSEGEAGGECDDSADVLASLSKARRKTSSRDAAHAPAAPSSSSMRMAMAMPMSAAAPSSVEGVYSAAVTQSVMNSVQKRAMQQKAIAR